MEVAIPLVIFTTMLAWSAGIFSSQSILALRRQGNGIQMAALMTSLATLVVGGVAVVFHLQHWERIFNGFGHITSGITQELIAIVVVAVFIVIYFIMLRRSGDGSVPGWVAALSIVASVALVIVMGHSYMMPARPVWDSVLQIGSLFGTAFLAGPATVAFIASVKKVELPSIGQLVSIGAIVDAVLTAIYMVYMQLAQNSIQLTQYYFDPTHPNYGITTGADLSLFSADCMGATAFTIVTLVLAVAFAFMGGKKGDWKTWGLLALVCALACAVGLRVAFYIMGYSVFLLY